MNFRAPMVGQVTCSDASSFGGGFCVSRGLTAFGVAAANAEVRGDVPEARGLCQVLSVGLFDGLGALRVACDMVGLPMAGHISVERDQVAHRVVESFFADTIFHDDVCTVNHEVVSRWALRFQNVGLILVGAGPPCQGVSGLNATRIIDLLRHHFPWAQVHSL